MAAVMCAFCPTCRPDHDVLPAEHNKKPGGKYRPHCNKKICVDTARNRPRPEQQRRERAPAARAPTAAAPAAVAPAAPPAAQPQATAPVPAAEVPNLYDGEVENDDDELTYVYQILGHRLVDESALTARALRYAAANIAASNGYPEEAFR